MARVEWRIQFCFCFPLSAFHSRSNAGEMLWQMLLESLHKFIVLLCIKKRILKKRTGISLDGFGGEGKFFIADFFNRVANFLKSRLGIAFEPFFYIGISKIACGFRRQTKRGIENDVTILLRCVENAFAIGEMAFFVREGAE